MASEHSSRGPQTTELTDSMNIIENIVDYGQIGVLAKQRERSPIEHVPAEILCDIFLSWIEEHNWWQGGHRLVFPNSPFLLTRVCSQWRKIIYGTPHLWASPHVRVPSGMDITDEWMETLVAYLARSKTCPLSVTLEAECMQTGLQKLIKALIPHVGRVYSLRISLPQYACKELQHIVIGEDGWANLENLSIITWGPLPPRSITHGHSLIFSNAPKLNEAMLNADDSQGSLLLWGFSLGLPLAQITKLVISGVFLTASDAHDIMVKCPLLEHCSLGHVSARLRDAVIPGLPISIFFHLRSLSVNFHANDEFHGNEASFFQPSIMPALQQLDIRATFHPVLSINTIPFEDEKAIVVLELLPVLVSFRASFIYTARIDDFFDAFTSDATSPAAPLVPRLERLDIDEYRFSDESRTLPTTLIVKAIASRWWSNAELATRPAVARLKYVRLSCKQDYSLSELSDGDAATIGRCKDEGLDVWISGMPYEVSSDIGSVNIDKEAIAAWVSGVSGARD